MLNPHIVLHQHTFTIYTAALHARVEALGMKMYHIGLFQLPIYMKKMTHTHMHW